MCCNQPVATRRVCKLISPPNEESRIMQVHLPLVAGGLDLIQEGKAHFGGTFWSFAIELCDKKGQLCGGFYRYNQSYLKVYNELKDAMG